MPETGMQVGRESVCIKAESERALWERLVPLSRDVRTLNFRAFEPLDPDRPGRGNGAGSRTLNAPAKGQGCWMVVHGVVLVFMKMSAYWAADTVPVITQTVTAGKVREFGWYLAGPGDLVNGDSFAQHQGHKAACTMDSLEVVTPTARLVFLPWTLLDVALRKDKNSINCDHELAWALAAAVARRAAMQQPAIWLSCPPYSELNYGWLLAHYVVALGVPPMTPITLRSCTHSYLATMTRRRLDAVRSQLDLLWRAGAIAYCDGDGQRAKSSDATIRRRRISLMVTGEAWREITNGGGGGYWDNPIAVMLTQQRLLRQFPKAIDVLQAP